MGRYLSCALALALAAWTCPALAQQTGPAAPSLAASTPAATPPPPTRLEWSVQARFRLWAPRNGLDAATAKSVNDDLETLLTDVGTHDSRLRDDVGGTYPGRLRRDVRRFVEDHAIQKAAVLAGVAAWNSDEDQYDLNYLYPNAYQVVVTVPGADATNGDCIWAWRVAAPPPGAPAVVRLTPERQPCATPAVFSLAAGASSRLSVAATITATSALTGDIHPSDPIQVEDKLMVSLGDSFAAGEGNPDKPARITPRPDQPTWLADWKYSWLKNDKVVANIQGPIWWDTPCHRSFQSQHVVAALRYAADHRHEAVTFISYACSGAAIYDGMLTPQAQPPGLYDRVGLPEKIAMAQIEALNRNLCPPRDGRSSAMPDDMAAYRVSRPWLPNLAPIVRALPNLLIGNVHVARYSCAMSTTDKGAVAKVPLPASHARRPVDFVLLSVGGNDVGFAPVIMDLMMPPPDDGFIVDAVRAYTTESAGVSNDRILNELPQSLVDMHERLRDVLCGVNRKRDPNVKPDPRHPYALAPAPACLASDPQVHAPPTNILQSIYPSPLSRAGIERCGEDAPPPLLGDDATVALKRQDDPTLMGALAAIPDYVRLDHHIHVVVYRRQTDNVLATVLTPLNQVVHDSATAREDDKNRWSTVDDFPPLFAGHGWCAGPVASDDSDPQMSWLPHWDNDKKSWTPWDPNDWRAYEDRDRYFRTPNDSIFTEAVKNPKRAPIISLFLHHREEAMNDSLAGSFHPTFQAQILMGLDVACRMERMTPGSPEAADPSACVIPDPLAVGASLP